MGSLTHKKSMIKLTIFKIICSFFREIRANWNPKQEYGARKPPIERGLSYDHNNSDQSGGG